jgi:uncharacterized membrane protein
MNYEHIISDIVKVVEAVGAAIMILGALFALGRFILSGITSGSRDGSYETLRRQLGQSILLGLEVLIIGDIVRTIIVDPTIDSVAVLGIIVVIRIVLSFSLEVEMDGVWPWARWRTKNPPGDEVLPDA